MKRPERKSRTLALRKPRKLGRRSLYSPAMKKRICRLLEKGNTIITTCDHVGITTTTFHNWCERDIDFLAATMRARGKARVRHVQTLTKAAKTDWRAAAWMLSHIWPQEFSELVRNEVGLLGGIVLLPRKNEGDE
jgi:hypothetical protein